MWGQFNVQFIYVIESHFYSKIVVILIGKLKYRITVPFFGNNGEYFIACFVEIEIVLIYILYT